MDILLQIIYLLAAVAEVIYGQDCTSLLVNTEVNAKCRFDLTSMPDDHRDLLRKLYNEGYALCIGCGYTNADHGRCHSIDVCRKGSQCIQAVNRYRAPDYYWHGCCDPADVNCRSGENRIHFNVFGRDTTLFYDKTACNGSICNENGYKDEKNALVSYILTGSTPAQTQATTASASSINGGWSNWSAWAACDKTCDLGLRTRTRSCTAPIPQNGGQYCPDNDNESELCNAFPCTS